jgi:hypothetical protein
VTPVDRALGTGRLPGPAGRTSPAARTRAKRARGLCCAWILAAGAFVLAPGLGCQKILGIHDIDGGPSASNDGGDMSSGSGSSTGSSSGSGSGASSSGNPLQIGSPSGSASGTSASGSGGLTGAACMITSDTHWTAGVYRIECDIRVDATLTIDPGATLKFDTGHGMYVSATGTLSASGTAASPIVFTSLRDNAYGGSTSSTSPSPGDWTGITLDANGSTFDHCGFYYAGAMDSAALTVNGNRATVTNSIFAHDHGPTDKAFSSAAALDAGHATAGSIIRSNIFYDNRLPLVISPSFSLEDDSNSFDNSAAAPMNPQPNTYNGIDYAGSGNCSTSFEIVSNITWGATKVPFVIGEPTSPDVCVNSGGQLTLAPGVTLKFLSGGALGVGGTGTLVTGSGDVFTSIKDDASGGDTNGDQSSSSPMPGDWGGISVNSSGLTFDHCAFYFAGASDTPALAANGNRITVTYSTFAHHQGTTNNFMAAPALDASQAAAGTVIQNNTFYGNLLPLRISPSVALDDSNSFVNGAAPSNPEPNKYNGIEYTGSGNCSTSFEVVDNIIWSATKVPFVIGNPNQVALCVDSGGHLTLGPNVTMKFFPGGRVGVGSTGTLTTDSSDVFTSIKDSTRGGNTDPGASAPAVGDWSGIMENNVCETWPNIDYSTSGCP